MALNKKKKKKTDISGIMATLQARRLDQLLADRLDAQGYLLEAIAKQMNTGANVGLWTAFTPAMVTAARAAPTLYVDSAGKPFVAAVK